LPGAVEEIQRLMSNSPFASCKIQAAENGANAGQNRNCPLHRFRPNILIQQMASNRSRVEVGVVESKLNFGKLAANVY
jgi:hypothetical protein